MYQPDTELSQGGGPSAYGPDPDRRRPLPVWPEPVVAAPAQANGVAEGAPPTVSTFALYAGRCEHLYAGATPGGRLIVTPNLDHLRMLDLSKAFRRAYGAADVVLNDSRFLDLLALRDLVLCKPGSDLAPEMLQRLAPGARAFVIGGGEPVGAFLSQKYPQVEFAAVEPTMGYIKRRGERRRLVAQVLAARPDMVFVCTGAPQSELFGAQLKRAGCVADIVCCGAALQMLAGVKQRAPMVYRRVGAEWAWRFIREPYTRRRYAADALFLLENLSRFLQLRRSGRTRFAQFIIKAG